MAVNIICLHKLNLRIKFDNDKTSKKNHRA
jgi:hypothetical protein